MIELLAEKLRDTGFERVPNAQVLMRTTETTKTYISIQNYPLTGGTFLAELFIGLRLEKVEATIYPFIKGVQPASNYFPTIMVPQGFFINGQAVREEVRDASDEQIIVYHWDQWLRLTGIPWLDNHQEAEQLYPFYRGQQRFRGHLLTGPLRLLAMAKIVGEPEITNVYQQIHQEMTQRGAPDNYLKRVALMAQALKVLSRDSLPGEA